MVHDPRIAWAGLHNHSTTAWPRAPVPRALSFHRLPSSFVALCVSLLLALFPFLIAAPLVSGYFIRLIGGKNGSFFFLLFFREL